jgi:hypothetical protein
MKCDGFLLLHAKSKVQNVLIIGGCIQNLEAKQQNSKTKPRRNV